MFKLKQIISFVLAAVCMASCGAMAQALEKTKITIAVGGKNLFYYLPLTIAERRGFFKDEGLNAEIVDFPGAARGKRDGDVVQRQRDVVSRHYLVFFSAFCAKLLS